MKDEDTGAKLPPTPFDRFAEFTRKIVSVPKTEIDEQARRFREEHPPRGPRKAGS
jgi:hypothetical protein